MEIIAELIDNMLHTSLRAWIGVGAIFVYMTIILATALFRIKKGDHLDHH